MNFDFISGNPLLALGQFAALLLLYLVIGLLPLLGVLYGFYFMLTLPMRRNERARLFLDVIELGQREGRTPEDALRHAATSRDRAFGVRFYVLAHYLNQNLRLGEALSRVPRLLPRQVIAMLQA